MNQLQDKIAVLITEVELGYLHFYNNSKYRAVFFSNKWSNEYSSTWNSMTPAIQSVERMLDGIN